MKEFSHEFIAAPDPARLCRARMAFVAFDEATNELVGVVRIHSDSIYESGEYAILLRSDLKGRGLGWALMQMIIEYAKSEGLKAISGRCPRREHRRCSRCAGSLGFEVKSDPAEPRHLQRQAEALRTRASGSASAGLPRIVPGRRLTRFLTMIIDHGTSTGTISAERMMHLA